MARNSSDDYKLQLNFVPLLNDPVATIFRSERENGDERPPEASGYRLPTCAGSDSWKQYWVRTTPAPNFQPFTTSLQTNVDLGRRLLFLALKESALHSRSEQEVVLPSNPFLQDVSLIIHTHKEGSETLSVQPYFLRSSRTLGFLVDFHFRLNPEEPFTRRVQMLSLSLTKNFRRNNDFYIDRFTKVRSFLLKCWDIFEAMKLDQNASLSFSKDFTSIAAERLLPKSYVFSGGKEKRAQYAGLREFGPLNGLAHAPRLLFVFREEDRQAARRLATTLKGSKRHSSSTWPGFEGVFRSPLELDSNPIVLKDLHAEEMRRALAEAEARAPETVGQIVPVLILPVGDDNGYLTQKAIFANASLPTQVCTLRLLDSDESLKWAVANLGLQIFCKAGGKPWKVRSVSNESLIIGISQSHKVREVDGHKSTEKYFAFSVLTDSTGLFKSIEVLGESTDHSSYLSNLRANLKNILVTQSGVFRKVVIHTSFRLKIDEVRAIEEVTRDVATERLACQFAVIKVNQQNRFFAYNRDINSLVPYEATKVTLGPHEYLLWFEGISMDKENVSKLFSGPTHIEFLKISENPSSVEEERLMLQDLINLSGANWRGFNAKSAPVSVFYCHLVARLVHHFHDQGLPMPAANDEHPWFL